MIKFHATNPENGRKILGLGLSHGNVKKLMAGQPIHFNAEDMGLARIAVSEILIFVGETEDAMRADLEAQGLLKGTRSIEDTSERRM